MKDSLTLSYYEETTKFPYLVGSLYKIDAQIRYFSIRQHSKNR